MKINVPSYFNDFKCIASKCEDTCCAGWGIVIDEETYKCYQSVDTEFGETLRSKIVEDEDGDNVFVLNGDDCPFLNKNNLCDIYTELGADNLCYTCRQYPRYMEEFFDLREVGISLSCPEAARIILGNDRVTSFEVSENDEAGDTDDSIDKEALDELFLCRKTIIDISENMNLPLEVRLAVILCFVEEVQDNIDFDQMEEIKNIRKQYSQSQFIDEIVNNLDEYKGNENIKYNQVHEYFKTYKNLEHINTSDPLGLENVLQKFWKNKEDEIFYIEKHKEFNKYYKDSMYKFKNIFVYFVFRYFMKSIFDYEVSSKIKIAIMSTIMIKELAVVRWIETGEFTESDMVDISHMYSKDIEHLEENIKTLEEIFETEEVYGVEQILMTLMNAF
ncbi:MAG: flagellin lysine-N-methylase [Cellulosilyticaceae bacterium]